MANENGRYNSTHGTRSSSRTESIRISKKTFVKSMTACLVAGAIVGGIATHEIPNLVNKWQEKSAVTSILSNYQKDIVSENTHRTSDNKNYFYDYVDIASAVTKDDSVIDEKLYAVYCRIGKTDTDKVISKMDQNYESIDEYLSQNDYSSASEWKQDIYKEMSLKNSISNNIEELQEMNNEYDQNTATSLDENSYGGK